LIADLVGDLRPVARPGRTGRALGVWLIGAFCYCAGIMLVTGPIRDGAFTALLSVPAYGIEIALALATVALLARAAVRSAIPSERPFAFDSAWPLVALAAWAALLLVGVFGEPALDGGMLGKRAHCFLETVLYSLPSAALLLLVVRRFLPLWPRATGALAGAAAAALPAAMMQLACMYEPTHALIYHLSSIPLVGALGAFVGAYALRSRAVVPRSSGRTAH
jgi:hypothetical protein